MDANRYRAQTETRVSRLLRGLRQLGKLGQRNGGVLSTNEVGHMFNVLREEVDDAHRKFTIRASEPEFRFGANSASE
jgi:hypothetical protein